MEAELVENPEIAAALDRLMEDPSDAAIISILSMLGGATQLLLHLGDLKSAYSAEKGTYLPGSEPAMA